MAAKTEIGTTRKKFLETDHWNGEPYVGEKTTLQAWQRAKEGMGRPGKHDPKPLGMLEKYPDRRNARTHGGGDGAHTVHIDHLGETEEGTINWEKVDMIRKQLRRRYSNRSNFQRIFREWDKDRTGELDAEEIRNMMG